LKLIAGAARFGLCKVFRDPPPLPPLSFAISEKFYLQITINRNTIAVITGNAPGSRKSSAANKPIIIAT